MQIAQLTLEASPVPAGTDSHGALAPRMSGVLVMRSTGTVHMLAADDVVALLAALLSNQPYRCRGQELRAHPVGSGQAALALSGGSVVRTVTMSRDRLFQQLLTVVTVVTTELARIGAGALAAPLVGVLTNVHPSPAE